MTIGYSTHINGEETRFMEKIWHGIYQQGLFNEDEYEKWFGGGSTDYEGHIEYNLGTTFDYDIANYAPKYHTIREDKPDRWKVGMKIHPVIGNRTKQRFQFAPILECKSIQKIEIRKDSNRSIFPSSIYVDDRLLTHNQVHELAQNDGFDSTEDFFKWFDKPFLGKIIHWSDLKY